MNKKQLIESMATKTGSTKADTERQLKAFMDTVQETLETDESVVLVGFGTFSVKMRNSRQGINPITKEKFMLPAKKVARFKFSPSSQKKIS